MDKAAPDAAYIVAISNLFAVTTDYLLKEGAPRTPPRTETAESVPVRTPGPIPSSRSVPLPRLLLTCGNVLFLMVILLYLVVYCSGFRRFHFIILLVLLSAPVLLAVSRGLLGNGPVDAAELKRYRRSFALSTALWGFAIALLCGFQEAVDDLLVRQVSGPFSIPLLLVLTAVLGLALYCLGLILGSVLTRKL